MKRNSTLIFFIVNLFAILCSGSGNAQCPAGYTAAELNWDHLDFLPSNNTRYTSFYPSSAFPYNQNFTLGTRTVNFVMAPASNITLNGENGTNTAHGMSPAVTAGDDVQFTTTSTSNTTITMTFDQEVMNVLFSLFDLDASQRVTITASNAGGTPQNVTMTKANGSSAITLSGPATAPVATGPSTTYSASDTRGSLNVSISGPVKRVVLTLSNATGDIWLSDIDACVTGSFPLNYQQISRPFTGQPQYVLAVVNNNIYYVDPTNGNGYFLFNEPGHDRLNSMAYDPYRRVVYYTYSLTQRVGLNPQVDKTLKKYDVDSKTISVVIPDVNTFGIPTYESGVESGSASFYNGSLYLGIEGYTGTTGSSAYAAGRKSTVWKIDFDASGNPIAPAAQVFGVTADNGTNASNIHDWSDFAVTDGILYDFDGSQSGGTDFYHFDLMSGVRTQYTPAGVIPKQVSIGWDENIYNVDAPISLYNGTTGVGTPYTIFAPLGPTIPTGSAASWGDAAGPYRPFLDFGDAPASYDPDPLSPACHDTLTPNVANARTKMQLGADEDVEWLKRGFTTVEDNFEDGLTFVPIFSPSNGSYTAQVTVFNNTGSNATVCAWLDFNGNGVFDPSESTVPVTIPSSSSQQSFFLNWPSTPSTLPNGSYTYLRIRITAASNNMNANNATGYYSTGEVEDYRIVVDDLPLPVTLISFDAVAQNNSKVKLNWVVSEDLNFPGYEVQRSSNGDHWEHVGYVPARQGGAAHQYELVDSKPMKGTSYYRLKLNEAGKVTSYSPIAAVRIIDMTASLMLFPNPAVDKATLLINSGYTSQEISLRILNQVGKLMSSEKIQLARGVNSISLPIQSTWSPGMYIVQVITGEETINKRLLVRR